MIHRENQHEPHPPVEQYGEGQRREAEGRAFEQRLTSAAFLGIVVAGLFAKDLFPVPVILAASVGYGIGSSAAVAYCRFSGLLKDGTGDRNTLSSAVFAGLAVFCGVTALQSVPAILKGDYIRDLNFVSGAISGLAGVAAGFIQSRSGFVGLAAVPAMAHQR